MQLEEAIQYLRPIADSASLPRYAEALKIAIASMEYQKGHIADDGKKVHGSLRVEVTTDDFVNKELASNGGWYRKRYFCPSCGQKLKEETYEKDHCFASWDLVREECPLHYCPNCGARTDLKG